LLRFLRTQRAASAIRLGRSRSQERTPAESAPVSSR